MRKQASKKLLSVLLALLMAVTILPVAAFAEGETGTDAVTAAPETEPAEAEQTEQTETETIVTEDLASLEQYAQPAAEVAVAATSDEFYRIVHLDCGRKYFSVANIEKLIDTMAKYGFNQLQLAFGNGGCRFLLDDMSLSFSSVTMSSDTVKTNITNGNNSFNGDTRYLTESDMDTIVSYATSKGIEIVPMLNMPGHATAIVYNTSYSSSGNLNVNDSTSREYGYALLGKYVTYFANKGCKFFHFGADESGYTGPDMTTFLAGCANVITAAGMTPRAFNDATSGATMPTSVQITYWHKETGSQYASALSNSGYSLINTHGRWYYVIKTDQGTSEVGTKYWRGTVNSNTVSVELPVMKAEKMDGKWVGINEFFTADPGSGDTISSNKGVMFCIWCDASQDTYLTDSDVISENENYGALYQIEKLAEHYWPDDIKSTDTDTKTTPTIVVDSENATGETVTVNNDGTYSVKVTSTENTLKVTVSNSSSAYTWSSSDSKIATVDNNGVVTFLSSGTVTITATEAAANSTNAIATVAEGDESNTLSVTFTAAIVEDSKGDSKGDSTTTVNIKVGETYTAAIDSTVTAGEYITDDNKYIATAVVADGEVAAAKVEKATSIKSGEQYLITTNDNHHYIVTNETATSTNFGGTAKGLVIGKDENLTIDSSTDSLSQYLWTITGDATNGYTVVDVNGKYLTIDGNSSVTLSSTQSTLKTVDYNDGLLAFHNGNYYLDNFGGTGHDYFNTLVSAWQRDSEDAVDYNNKWQLYKITAASTGESTLTFTGTGEGTTTVTVGGITYTVNVTAPTTTETKTVAYGETLTLPEGATNIQLTDLSTEGVLTLTDGVITTGSADGTATVTCEVLNAGNKVIAKYTYTVTVTSVNLDNVASLPVQLWITNTYVGADEAPTTVQTVKIAAKDAYGEDGILLGSKVPSTGYKKDGEKVVSVAFWKGVVLHDGTAPSNGGADYSNSGDKFTKVRYWNNSWQYLLDGVWKSIDLTDGADTVIAYYLQLNDVSPEIITGTKDYGNPPTSNPGYTSSTGYCLTAFAVVYPDGTLSRTEEEMYKTGMVRGFWGGDKCNIGYIYAGGNSNYKISKITLTWGTNKYTSGKSSDGDIWYTGNKTTDYGTDWGVTWNKKTNSAGAEWYDETVYWKAGDSEIPMIDGEEEGLYLTQENNAALILIYLEAVATDDTLEIVYWDDNANKQIVNPIAVVVNSGVTYLDATNGIQQTSAVKAGEFTLDDNAYIVNSDGSKQHFNKELSKVPNVPDVYASGLYTYQKAEISEDGKTLTLHYNIAETTKTYVADFGLPLVIEATEFIEADKINTIKDASLTALAGTHTLNLGCGTATFDPDANWKLTFTLTSMMFDGKVTIPIYVTFTDDTALSGISVTIIPATTVYYEDGFATFTNGSTAQWTIDGTETTADQALDELGDKNSNVYGYDPAYTKCTTFSLGSAHKVTVSSGMTTWPTAQFTFKGTGFDIISLTDNNSGAITVEVYKGKTTDTYVKGYIVDNYYGYTYNSADGTWTTTTGDNALYQIPVMKVTGLDYDEYTAVITVFYDDAFDHTTDNSYSFWLDAVRVYDPAGTSQDTNYVSDNEGYPQYIKLRDQLVSGTATTDTNKLLFIDGKENAEVSEYANYGPNNEVYLANGQAITFTLSGDLDNIATVQIGAKSPNGSDTDKAGMVVGNADAVQIGTATEMYYDISSVKDGNTVTITNTGNAILSLTNLKITYTTSGTVSLGTVAEEQQTQAVMMVRSLFAAASVEPEPEPEPEPEKVFEPERFEASWTSNVTKGRKATLTVKTSTDVEAITVNGETITSYRTRTERTGFGWNAQKVTYRQFTYTVTASESADYTVTAVDAEGTESAAITATLTVSERGSSFWNFWNSVKSLF